MVFLFLSPTDTLGVQCEDEAPRGELLVRLSPACKLPPQAHGVGSSAPAAVGGALFTEADLTGAQVPLSCTGLVPILTLVTGCGLMCA